MAPTYSTEFETSDMNTKVDEQGKYFLLEKTRQIPRRTYIQANINGKFWGEIDEFYSTQFSNSKFFNFNIYEVTLTNAKYSKVPFPNNLDLKFPREQLPKLLNTILEKDDKEYEINLHEPVFTDEVVFNQKLHQIDGNTVYGTIDSQVTGYILDFITETYFEKEYINVTPDHSPISSATVLSKTNTPTGNVEYYKGYKRIERYYSDYEQTYWDNWEYTKPPTAVNNQGCFSFGAKLFIALLGIVFVLLLLPRLLIALPFLAFLFLLNLIPSHFLVRIFRFLGYLLLVGFLISLLFFIININSKTYIPKPQLVEQPEEQKVKSESIYDTVDSKPIQDVLIKHFRAWRDYDGNLYQGNIWTKQSDFSNAKLYKNSLVINSDKSNAYDEMVYRLKENDKDNLAGVYQLFDSINAVKKLTKVKFAEMIVSFVQDIPYVIILNDDCNPNLYDDNFIKEYLSSKNALCDGNEKFGINSPVEFMTNLNGDCDTRTLFLYTILSHYNYDVALLVSENYGHSIIGINLPMDGISYEFHDKHYLLWETTAPNFKPGVIPNEISNLTYWRISLKSK